MRATRLILPAVIATCLLAAEPSASSNLSNRSPSTEQPTAKGSSGTAEQEIKALEAQRIEAILKGDTTFFERYFSDDYVAIRGDGKLTTKAQEIENLKAGTTKYESIDEHELMVRIYGDTAISNGLSSIRATINGKSYAGDVRNTRVWVRLEGNWRLVTFQATRVAPAG